MKLFVCYRPADLEEAVRLHDGLAAVFGYDPVIQDYEAIPVPDDGMRRATCVGDWLRAASAMLVVIGPGWLEAIDTRGLRRLTGRADPVRPVIEAAGSLGIPLVPALVGGARFPDAAALPPTLQGLLWRSPHAIRRGPGFEADVDGLAAELVWIRDAPVRPVTCIEKSEHEKGTRFRWEVRFVMRTAHSIVYERKGYPYVCRLVVDGVEVWRSKRSFFHLPTAHVHFRIESENAEGWLVLEELYNWAVLGQIVDIWIENTKIMHLKRTGFWTQEWW